MKKDYTKEIDVNIDLKCLEDILKINISGKN